MIANIALDDALILPHRANPHRIEFSGTTGRHAMSIRARKPPQGELDAFAGEFAPGFDLGHVGRFGKAAEHFARLLPRLLARQREGLASKRVAWPRAERFR
jgi:hypothetical protein